MSVSESWLLSLKYYYNPVAKDKVVQSILMGKLFKHILTNDQYVKLMIKQDVAQQQTNGAENRLDSSLCPPA